MVTSKDILKGSIFIFCLFGVFLSISIGTFNIQAGRNMDGQYALNGTISAISQLLLPLHVIGLQEVDNGTSRSPHDQLRELSHRIPFKYYQFLKNRGFQGGAYGVGVLSNLPILKVVTYNFRKPTNSTSDSYSVDPCDEYKPEDFCQGVLAVLLDLPLGIDKHTTSKKPPSRILERQQQPQQFWFLITHFGLSSQGEWVQLEEGRQTLRFIQQLLQDHEVSTMQQLQQNSTSSNIAIKSSNKVILSGDLNVSPDSETYKLLTTTKIGGGEYLHDIWQKCGPFGNPGWTFPSRIASRRIDYLFSNFPLMQRHACSSFVPQTLASDHLPVKAELSI